jgi:SAM-dependent methyltransferase
MQNNNDILRWSACWKATTSAVHEEPDEKKLADAWDKRWEKRPETPGPGPDAEHMRRAAQETIDFLKESGFRPAGSTVLDIGCGPGVLSLPLAREGAEVTSLDISPRTLERLGETAKKENLSLTTKACSWWSADIDELGLRNGYDLVIASRTPAINDAETLEKMMACSRKFCYYSSFLNVGENPVHRDILKLLNPEAENVEDRRKHAHNAYTMVFPFMYLYLFGYHPLVRLNDVQRDTTPDWKKEAEQAIRFFGHEHELDDGKKEKIRNYFRDAEKDGHQPHMSGGECHGMMTWKVQDKA